MTSTRPIALSDGERAVVELAGELDFATSQHLRDLDLDALAGGGCRELVVDMARVDFIDSSGIGALVRLHNDVIARGLRLEVVALSVPVERTLVMAGLSNLFGLNAHA